MDTVNTGLRDMFVLLVILVLAVYYVGVSTDTATFTQSLTGLINAATGRNSQGQFVGYAPH